MNSNERFNQLEELMSNLTRNVDRLTAKMDQLEEYTHENNKVINSILHKLDDHAEQFEKHDRRFDEMMKEMTAERKLRDSQFEETVADRKLRDAQFEFVLKKFNESK